VTKKRSFLSFETWGQRYKTFLRPFFVRNKLEFFVSDKFLQPNQMLASKASNLKHLSVLHSKEGSWPSPQTLDWASKVCQGQTLQLIKSLAWLGSEPDAVFVVMCDPSMNKLWVT